MIGRLRHQANLALTWALVRARRLRERRDVLLLRLRSLPVLWRPEHPVAQPNTFFSTADRRLLRGHVQRAAHREPGLRLRLADTRIKGLRAWEYGRLLALLSAQAQSSGWEALDVGAGKSAFPGYLLRTGNVGGMTTLDLPLSYEIDPAAGEPTHDCVERAYGSMVDMPFDDDSFDLVLSVSAIEHLDGDRLASKHGRPGGERLPYASYLAATRRALAEMIRVLRPGGFLYLTSDAYMPELQKVDAWAGTVRRERIWSAYRMEDIEDLFVKPVLERGLELVGGHDYRPALLVDDPRRATYRGRYFTTFALWARRP